MAKSETIIGLDVGEKRIGVAIASSDVLIAVPLETIEVDGNEINNISDLFTDNNAEIIVIGYPRNQSGEATKQTEFVEVFRDKLSDITPNIVFQDESVTSIIAEQQLANHNRPYSKADIDMQAAAIILQDYLEKNYGK